MCQKAKDYPRETEELCLERWSARTEIKIVKSISSTVVLKLLTFSLISLASRGQHSRSNNQSETLFGNRRCSRNLLNISLALKNSFSRLQFCQHQELRCSCQFIIEITTRLISIISALKFKSQAI